MSGKVAIIIVNWNKPHDTTECLESLLPCVTEQEACLIVCDNYSQDNSIKIIRTWGEQRFPAKRSADNGMLGFILMQTDQNLGYAGGNNVGIRYALEKQFQFIWILNNDTVVLPGALEALTKAADQYPTVAAFGSTLVDHQNPEIVQCAGGCRYYPIWTITREIYSGHRRQWVEQQSEAIEMDYICGASMFIRASAIRKIGLLNESFFLYYEELEFTKRLKNKGYQIAWCPASVVSHKKGGSTGNENAGTVHYYENLSTLKYTWLYYPRLFVFAALFRMLAKLTLLPLTGRSNLLGSLFRSYADFFVWLTTRDGRWTGSEGPVRTIFAGIRYTEQSTLNDCEKR